MGCDVPQTAIGPVADTKLLVKMGDVVDLLKAFETARKHAA
jgi:hypothetical protein